MDLKAVGQKVKQIYPEYNDISDEQLGLKFITKYGKDENAMAALGVQGTGDVKEAANLRKEFAKETKDSNFKFVQDAYRRTKDVPNTGAGDLSLIYSFIKALDPTSVVREGEINISKATGSVPENLLTAYKRVKEGKLLSDQQRAEYKGEIGRFYNEKAKEQQQRNAFYSGLASDMQIDPQKIIGEYSNLELADIPEAPQQQQLGGPLGGILGLAGGAAKQLIPETLAIPHYFTYPHTPKMNGRAERLIQTVEYEFFNYQYDLLPDIDEINKRCEIFNDKYNNRRYNRAISYRTPAQVVMLYLQKGGQPFSI